MTCSPARRARETADALGVRYKVSERLAPGAAPSDILEAAGWPSHKGALGKAFGSIVVLAGLYVLIRSLLDT